MVDWIIQADVEDNKVSLTYHLLDLEEKANAYLICSTDHLMINALIEIHWKMK